MNTNLLTGILKEEEEGEIRGRISPVF